MASNVLKVDFVKWPDPMVPGAMWFRFYLPRNRVVDRYVPPMDIQAWDRSEP